MANFKRENLVLSAAVLIGAVLLAPGCAGGGDEEGEASPGQPEPGEPDLTAVREATERFRDVEVALEAGYVRDPFDLCDTAEMLGRPPELGAMGVHYVRPDLLGLEGPPDPRVRGTGTHTDFRTPGILIYEPREDGSLELVAVENLVFADAWRAAGHEEPPSFHGVPYDYMDDDPTTEADEAHMFDPHWDRHVWLYRENPNGIFAPFNPNVSCEHHRGATHAQHVRQPPPQAPRALSARTPSDR